MSEIPPLPPCPPNSDEPVDGLPIDSRDGEELEPEGDRGGKPAATPKTAAPPLPPQASQAEAASDEPPDWQSNDGYVESSAWLVSFVIHAVMLFLCGLITLNERPSGTPVTLAGTTDDGDLGPAGVDDRPFDGEPGSDKSGNVDSPKEDLTFNAVPTEEPLEAPKAATKFEKAERPADNGPAAPGPVAPGPGGGVSGEGRSAGSSDGPSGGGWEGRTAGNRAARTGGGRGSGSKQSEQAVERGLRWLVAHQRDDGSWCFDLQRPPCNGLCRNSGSEASTTASTGLALLPFLGAGYTQTHGEHQEVVKRGLYYLSTRAVVTPHGIDLRDGGTMYAQGIATLAFCEAYGMTHDASLREIAQGAIRFIVYAQDIQGGGWRYTPGTPGDMTVTGWQLMALKSGQMAKLEVPSPTISLVQKFMDSVQFDQGSRYGYLMAKQRAPTQETTTAVGLLCRMYTGWNRSHPGLYRGVEHLHKWGASKTDMYYDYYATQVLHHWQGPEWQAWNKPMRDYLVKTQSQESHEAGSWYFPDPYGDHGGRLYNTAMAIMILEVYYRHMPLYGEEAVHDQF